MEDQNNKKKPFSVGLRMTKDQRSLLSNIEEKAGLSKTKILIKGLELLSEYHSLGLDKAPLSLELRELEKEAMHHAEALSRIRRREDALKDMVRELRVIDELVDKYNVDESSVIQILIDVQDRFNWISKPAIMWITERLNVPASLIYQIATFYKFFSLTPRGRHLAKVCLGTACHVRGGPKIMEAAERTLGIEHGDVTPDGEFSLERVNCLGCCALGPVMVVDNEYHGNLKPTQVSKILSKHLSKR